MPTQPGYQLLLDARRWTRDQASSLVTLLEAFRDTVAGDMVIPFSLATATWTNQPAAVTPLFGGAAGALAAPIDLSRYDEVKVSAYVSTIGHTSAVLGAYFATTGPTVAGNYASLGASCPLSATGVIDGDWVEIPAAYKTAGFLSVFGSGGNGVADPVIGAIRAWLR